MNIVEYNIRIVIFHLIIITGTLWILLGGIHALKNKPLKIALIVLTMIVIIAFVFSLFGSLSYRDKISASGKIIDVTHTGSIAGILDTFAIRVEHSDGTTKWYHTSIFSSSSFKKSIDQLKIDDVVDLYINNFFNLFYKYEKINIE